MQTLQNQQLENQSTTQKLEKSRTRSGHSTKRNMFQKVISFVTRERSPSVSSMTSSESSDERKIILRWTSSCLRANCPIFSRNPQFNMIYCPLPSLLMYMIIHLSSDDTVTQQLETLFKFSEDDCREITRQCIKLRKFTSKKSFYFFVRFLVDEEKNTTVSKELMAKSSALANEQIFASIRPSRVLKYLSTISSGHVTIPRPALLTTNAYTSTGLNANWPPLTEARIAGRFRFAVTYSKRINETFFELDTDFRRCVLDDFEIFEIRLETNDGRRTPGSFLIFRPHFIGNLAYANRHINERMLSKVVHRLEKEKVRHGRLLLPQFSVTSRHDLWKNLLHHGIQSDLGRSQKLPPISSLWYWTSLTVSNEGIRCLTKGQDQIETDDDVSQRRISGDLLFKKAPSYSARIDSPFSYLITLTDIPLFAGSFFGNIPPLQQDMFMTAPERIRKRKKRQIIKKKKRPETRRQKLLKKIRISKEKERRRRKKDDALKTSENSVINNKSKEKESNNSKEKSLIFPDSSQSKEERNKSNSNGGWKKMLGFFHK